MRRRDATILTLLPFLVQTAKHQEATSEPTLAVSSAFIRPMCWHSWIATTRTGKLHLTKEMAGLSHSVYLKDVLVG